VQELPNHHEGVVNGLTKRQNETEQEYYARRQRYFKTHYQKTRVGRLEYQAEYYRRPGVKEHKREYDRMRYAGVVEEAA
jgi:hypothetical protein